MVLKEICFDKSGWKIIAVSESSFFLCETYECLAFFTTFEVALQGRRKVWKSGGISIFFEGEGIICPQVEIGLTDL